MRTSKKNNITEGMTGTAGPHNINIEEKSDYSVQGNDKKRLREDSFDSSQAVGSYPITTPKKNKNPTTLINLNNANNTPQQPEVLAAANNSQLPFFYKYITSSAQGFFSSLAYGFNSAISSAASVLPNPMSMSSITSTVSDTKHLDPMAIFKCEETGQIITKDQKKLVHFLGLFLPNRTAIDYTRYIPFTEIGPIAAYTTAVRQMDRANVDREELYQGAIEYFAKMLALLVAPGQDGNQVVICAVPSSDKNKIDHGPTALAAKLAEITGNIHGTEHLKSNNIDFFAGKRVLLLDDVNHTNKSMDQWLNDLSPVAGRVVGLSLSAVCTKENRKDNILTHFEKWAREVISTNQDFAHLKTVFATMDKVFNDTLESPLAPINEQDVNRTGSIQPKHLKFTCSP